MAYAGFLASTGRVELWLAVAIGALGNLVGSLVAYFIGYVMGDKWVTKAIARWGKYLLVRQTEFDKVKEWFARHGQAVSFYSRMLPVVRTYISLPVGIARANVIVFSALTLLGSVIWSAVLAWVGFTLGANWRSIEPLFRHVEIGLVALFLIALFVVWRKRKAHAN